MEGQLMILEREGRREENQELPQCHVLGSPQASPLVLQRCTLKSGEGRGLAENPGHALHPGTLAPRKAPAGCRALTSPGRETTQQDPISEP